MPHQDHAGTCRLCHKPVLWTVTERNRRQAVNPDPDPAGNLACHTDVAGRLRSRSLTKDRPTLEGSEWQAMPHAATCAPAQPQLVPQLRPRTGSRPGRRRTPYWRQP